VVFTVGLGQKARRLVYFLNTAMSKKLCGTPPKEWLHVVQNMIGAGFLTGENTGFADPPEQVSS
jgi:hypothetical protein